MKDQEIKELLMRYIDERLALFGIGKAEIDMNFDLVKSGLLDSMAFVDMISALEEEIKVQVDFEKLMDEERFTTFQGVIELFTETPDE